MLKSILIAAVCVLASTAAAAQEKGEKRAFDLIGPRQGWAVEAAAGTLFAMGDSHIKMSALDRVMFSGSLSVSKQLTPVMGIGGQIGVLHRQVVALYDKEGFPVGNYAAKRWVLLPTFNMLVNFSNLFSGYKPNHLYNAILAIGGGFYAGRQELMNRVYHNYGVTFDFALKNQFRITDYLSASVNISGLMLLYRFGESSANLPNCSPACTIGLVYRFLTR